MLVPYGDRRNRTQSGRVINQKDVSIRNDHIMRELILSDHFCNDLWMYSIFRFGRGPSKDLIQSGMHIDLGNDLIEFRWR